MPESKSDQVRHSNEEVWNFLSCGDARGPGWLAGHPADRERAAGRLQGRDIPGPGSISPSEQAGAAFQGVSMTGISPA